MKRIKLVSVILATLLCDAFVPAAASGNASPGVPAELVWQLIKDINANERKFRLTKKDLKVLRARLRYELHDLNADSRPEVFLYIDHSDWCGAGGNCDYWVYRKAARGYQLLLEEKVLRVKGTYTNGYKDLESHVRIGFCAENVQRTSISLYKYDGEQYQFVSRKDECIPFTPKN
jgi:hypothetical protein